MSAREAYIWNKLTGVTPVISESPERFGLIERNVSEVLEDDIPILLIYR